MHEIFRQFISESRVIRPARAASHTLCVFCHYDPDGMIAEYVVQYVKALSESGCDVVFVSNAPTLAEQELAKVTPHVMQIILRQNKGYDMAAYFTGYVETAALHEQYAHVLFTNDSVYGPFYPLTKVFAQLEQEAWDLAGISDSIDGGYHVQSYFWWFKNTANIHAFLDEQAKQFVFVDKKKEVVSRYERGICRAMIHRGFRLGALCPLHRVISFERWETKDRHVLELKKALAHMVRSRLSVTKRIRAVFSKKARAYFHPSYVPLEVYGSSSYGSWYAMIRYFSCPFLKVLPLKNLKTFFLGHQFLYVTLLREMYPDYDLEWIEGHLKRVRR